MSTPDDWTKAYARQARADFDTWEKFQEGEAVPECHQLLFLQMACEKLTKAHLCAEGIDPRQLQSSHAYTAKNLHLVLKQQITFSKTRIKNVARAAG